MEIDKYFRKYADLIRFHIASTSAEILVNRATAIFSQDILNIPYVANAKKTFISEADKIILKDILTYYLRFFDEKIFKPVTDNEITVFSNIFCKTLNSVYESAGKSFQLYKILDTDTYCALHFRYSNKSIVPVHENHFELEEYIKQVIPSKDKSNTHVHIQRIMKIYSKDSIILAKPKHFRYWLSSIALRDADESFSDYVKAGF